MMIKHSIYTCIILCFLFTSCDNNGTVFIDKNEMNEVMNHYCEFTNNHKVNNHLEYLFIPSIKNYGPDCYIQTFIISVDEFRLFIYNREGKLVLRAKEDGQSFLSDYYKYQSITPIIDANSYETVGYVKFRFSSSDSYANSGIRAYLNYSIVSNRENAKLLMQMENREQIVLLGGSKFGNYWSNLLPDYLMGLTKCYVYNCGFGGCSMAWRSKSGTDPYDYFSFSSICESISNASFDPQMSHMPLGTYRYQLNNLINVDFSKPTTIIVNYSTNDITKGIELGEVI